MKRKIIVEIDAMAKKCEDCNLEMLARCLAYEVNLRIDNEGRTTRCPACLKAEKEAAR
jgi:hypothetical protein